MAKKACLNLRHFSSFVLSLILSISFSSSSVWASQREFDYFLLALQWPGTICAKTKHCCSNNGCCRSEPITYFTIHGLWADYDDGTWPSCCTHAGFDINKVESLMPELQKYWPSLYCSSSKRCFGGKGPIWAHEWEKHGTCSYPVIQDEYDYFATTLNLYTKYNVTRILENADIDAENSAKYLLGDVVSAIKNEFGATPLLVCKHGSVEELRICFNKDFSPRDCVTGLSSNLMDDVSKSSSSCPRYISLPTYEPLGKLVNGNPSTSTLLVLFVDLKSRLSYQQKTKVA
ncbi:hypothetical protein LUZ61_011921 [Rhynchospora tenuis]|uniref:Uncharacterized protein n=1 Tax=Rhynchospora tenuis TaxID=198213 RepID=A0AAD6A1Z3_9POAL|nr:hypothetical protein LUZ61_011921 [Rhynchospora tenuis]